MESLVLDGEAVGSAAKKDLWTAPTIPNRQNNLNISGRWLFGLEFSNPFLKRVGFCPGSEFDVPALRFRLFQGSGPNL